MAWKKTIADIKYEGTNREFVWRSPIMDFDTGSRVTVYESQEALFYYNGECVGVLGPGIHILETEHIPFLRKILQKITGSESIFHAQVYFVNKVVLDMKWGAGDIVYQDPAGPVFNIGCFGQMNLAARQPRKIVEKLVGTQAGLTEGEVEMKFRQLLMSEVRDKLVNTMLDHQISITQLSAKLSSIAALLYPSVTELFDSYGFSVEEFCISGANIPEGDPEYQRLKRLRANQGMMFSELQLKQQEELIRAQTEAEKIRIQAQAQAFKRQTEGYDYATEKQFEFLNTIAANQNAGAGISSDMLQMGAGLGMIGAVSGMMQGMTPPYVNAMGALVQGQGNQSPVNGVMSGITPQNPSESGERGAGQTPPEKEACQAEAPGREPDARESDPVAVLTQLKRLLDAGLIEQEEYDAKKREVLNRM